jgi:error-prone DNA polymerase
MADADAFRSICLDRRQALWEVSTRDAQRQALFTGSQQGNEIEEKIALPEMTTSEHVVHDYLTTSLSLKAHPLSFLRDELSRLNIRTAASLESARDGDVVKVAGLVLVRQRPGTASGICFISIEDETATANLVVFRKLFDQYRKEIVRSRLLMVEGKLQREGEVIHVIVRRCYDFSRLLKVLMTGEELSVKPMSRADETTNPHPSQKHTEPEVVQGKIFPEGRNFR